jgi:hypothetical protein
MVEITDQYMDRRLELVRPFCTVFLKAGPAYEPPATRSPGQASIVREHGRRNMQLSAEGKMLLVGPLSGAFPLVGLCIFSVPEEEARTIMAGDGAVQAQIFTYDLVTLYGFPGDGLPAQPAAGP